MNKQIKNHVIKIIMKMKFSIKIIRLIIMISIIIIMMIIKITIITMIIMISIIIITMITMIIMIMTIIMTIINPHTAHKLIDTMIWRLDNMETIVIHGGIPLD